MLEREAWECEGRRQLREEPCHGKCPRTLHPRAGTCVDEDAPDLLAGADRPFHTAPVVSQEQGSAVDITPSQLSHLLGQMSEKDDEAFENTNTGCDFGYCRRGDKCCILAYDVILGHLCPTDSNYCVSDPEDLPVLVEL